MMNRDRVDDVDWRPLAESLAEHVARHQQLFPVWRDALASVTGCQHLWVDEPEQIVHTTVAPS